MATTPEQHAALLRNLHRGFDLTDTEASTLAEALRRGGPLAKVMHCEIMVGHPRLKSQHTQLNDQLRDYLVRCGVEAHWVTLLTTTIRPQFKYIYYILRDGEIYGGFALSETPI